MSDNWLADELTCPTSPSDIGRYLSLLIVFNLVFSTNQFSYYFDAKSKRFKLDIRVVHVRDLNFVLRSEIFMHSDE